MRKSANLPWFNTAYHQLVTQLNDESLAHSLLVGIGSGFGGDRFCEDIAGAAFCENLTDYGACGNCKSCQLFIANNHPDFYQIKADGLQIKIDQIRGLCEKLSQTAQQGGRRVAVIYDAHKLNQAAANALLKTLEEPGKGTLLILQSERKSGLLPTIRSRCQELSVPIPSTQDISLWLAQEQAINEPITWALPVVGGPIALAQHYHQGQYQELMAFRKDWQHSLASGHLHGSILSLTESNIFEALVVLYLLLLAKIKRGNKNDAFLINKIAHLAAKVMQQQQELQVKGTVNYLALCQQLILEYKKIVSGS